MRGSKKRYLLFLSCIVVALLGAAAFFLRDALVAEFHRTRLHSSDPEEQAAAVARFTEQPYRRAVPDLLLLFVDAAGDLEELRATSGLLILAQSPYSIAFQAEKAYLKPALLRSLQSNDPKAQFWALFLLRTYRNVPDSALIRMAALIRDGAHPLVRLHAVDGVARLEVSPKRILEKLAPALRDSDHQVCYNALHKLVSLRCDFEPVRRQLDVLTKHPVDHIRSLARHLSNRSPGSPEHKQE